MLTQKALDAVWKQSQAHGEGRHRFGHGTERMAPVPRDKEARPKTPPPQE